MAKTILIVDDSSSLRMVVKLALNRAGYDVLEAADGKEGLAQLEKAGKVHLIVSDVNKRSVAEQIGMRVGDRITEINGRKIDSLFGVFAEVHPSAGTPVDIMVRRGDKEVALRGTPRPGVVENREFVTVTKVPAGAKLAVRPGDQIAQIDGKIDYEAFGKEKMEPLAAARRILDEKAKAGAKGSRKNVERQLKK